jgi:rhodanese-related sulfurtransferase
MIKYSVYEAVFIILAAIFIALVVNALRPAGIDIFVDRNTPAVQDVDSPARILGVDDAIKKHNENIGIFVDARSPDEFAAGHIPGAVSLPDSFFDDMIETFIVKIDPQSDIITYCSSIDCHQAQDLAEKLCFAGFENVFYFAGGLSLWMEYKMPVQNMPVQADLDNAISR